jgi:hypothetical protein
MSKTKTLFNNQQLESSHDILAGEKEFKLKVYNIILSFGILSESHDMWTMFNPWWNW